MASTDEEKGHQPLGEEKADSEEFPAVHRVETFGGAGPPYRGGDEPAGAGLWSCQTDHARESVQSDDHELPWQGGSDREVTG